MCACWGCGLSHEPCHYMRNLGPSQLLYNTYTYMKRDLQNRPIRMTYRGELQKRLVKT